MPVRPDVVLDLRGKPIELSNPDRILRRKLPCRRLSHRRRYEQYAGKQKPHYVLDEGNTQVVSGISPNPIRHCSESQLELSVVAATKAINRRTPCLSSLVFSSKTMPIP